MVLTVSLLSVPFPSNTYASLMPLPRGLLKRLLNFANILGMTVKKEQKQEWDANTLYISLHDPSYSHTQHCCCEELAAIMLGLVDSSPEAEGVLLLLLAAAVA